VGLTITPALRHQWWTVGWVAAITLYNMVRLLRPVRDRGDLRGAAALDLEVAFHLAAVITTGRWESPVAFPLLTAVMVVGFSRGFAPALRTAAGSALVVGIASAVAGPVDSETGRLVLQWTMEILLVGLVAGYVRRIMGEANRQQSDALGRLSQLMNANALLSELHRVAQSLPESFDLNDTLETTMARLRELFDADATAVLIHDDTGDQWLVMRIEGAGPAILPGTSFTSPQLPHAMHQALLTRNVVVVDDLLKRGRGLTMNARSGAYAPLVAREAVVGLLALEYQDRRHIPDRQAELMNGLVVPVGLAVDNARWFERLRTIGAEEERTRIARDLHDRIGQSLAYVAFEFDRIIKNQSRGVDTTSALQQLRGDLRGVIGEVRDTLYDLRTDVSETTDMSTTLRSFLTRVSERSGLRMVIDSQETRRLPLVQEREMWRIAQEAVTNVERHARAHRVRVTWRCEDDGAELEIEDDGIGFPVGRAGRLDSYGILGMRERAASMGATLEIDSGDGRGTRIRCRLRS
jgi:signal transduction histidine kinase